MKRILIALFLVLSLVICLPACTEESITDYIEYTAFNEMFSANFDNYTITVVTTSYNNDVLNDTYVVSTIAGITYVRYTIETLNEFVIEGDTISIPDGYKTVTEGVYNDNTDAEIVESFKVPKFNFSSSCISSVNITDSTLTADINSLKDFMGLNLEVTDATVRVEYEGTSLSCVVISYDTVEGNSVVITYTLN